MQEEVLNFLKTEKFLKTLKSVNGKINIADKEITEFAYRVIQDRLKEKCNIENITHEEIDEYLNKIIEDGGYKEETKKLTYGDWHDNLIRTKTGDVKSDLRNVRLYFENDSAYEDKFRFNELTEIEMLGDKELEDYHINRFIEDMNKAINIDKERYVNIIVQNMCREHSYHPYKEEIEKLTWDGVERLEDFFIKFVGADDIKLNRTMTKNWFYGLIKRIYEPGCDFDYMLIIQDPKGGTGKSKIMERFIKVFDIDYGYDSTITADVSNKDNVDKLNKAIVVSFEELADFDKKELPQVKAFISATCDVARLSYAHRSKNYKRHCVFYGNSNEEFCLNDYTSPEESERRFWLMEAHGERRDSKWWRENLTSEYLKQMWAEAYYLYISEPYYEYQLTRDESDELREIQNRHKKIGYEDVLANDITTLLDKTYNIENPYFETEAELFKYFDDTSIHIGSQTQIEKVPVVWLKSYIEKRLHKSVTTNKLTMMLRDHWRYDQLKINGTKIHAYRRIDTCIKVDNSCDQPNKSYEAGLPF